MSDENERVLCFERRLLDELGAFQGICLDVESYHPAFTVPQNVVYRLRSEAETDKRFKQLIPYVLIFHNNRILRYRRGSGGGESRLHGKYSVGIGGHIADVDHELFSTDAVGYREGMIREVREEVELESEQEWMVAVINDDSTEVGQVHFGVVHIMQVPNEDIVGRRSGILSPEFVDLSVATKNLDNYESWSRFCLENIDLLLSKTDLVQSLTN